MSYIEPPPPPPPSAPQPAARSRTRSRGRAFAWVAGAVVLLLAAAGAAVAFVPSVSQLVGLSAGASPTAGPPSTQTSKPTAAQTSPPAPSPTATASASPTSTFRIAREITASPSSSPEPTQQPSSSASDEPSASSSPTDLGLDQRVDILPCTGEYVSFHFSAIDPSSYASDISDSLNKYPGSRYLLTEGSCDALNQASKQNTRIYAVYSGPYATAEEACQNQREYPGGYVTHLRPANDLDPTVDCS